jgi:hypothetical protein
MAYAHVVTFDIKPEFEQALRLGTPLERALQYMRAILPNSQGYLSSYGLRTVGNRGNINVLFISLWETWEDLERHRASGLIEQNLIEEFEPHVPLEDMTIRIYEEVL